MCQAQEEYGGCDPPRRRPQVSCAEKCMKCKEASPVLVIRVGDAFCKACFREYFVHKFRAMLGKNRAIYPGEKVLLALSGGPASSSMLRQVQEGLSRETAKKLRFIPGIIYVDEGAVCGQSLAERGDTLLQMETILQASRFPYHLAHLEEVFDLPSSILQHAPHNPTGPKNSYKEAVEGFIRQQRREEGGSPSLPERQIQEKLAEVSLRDVPGMEGLADPEARLLAAVRTEQLIRLFGSVKTLTAKEELLQTLRNHLILHTARTQGYSKVMMGESCTRLAVKLLTNLSLGRGASLAMDTGFSDDRHGDVVVVRPMREYSAKEIAFYNHLFGVPTVFTPALDTKALEKASIHRVIERFVYGLQAEFPSTVSTVYRTGEKLSVTPGDASPAAEPERCLLCLCALDTNVEDGSALQAILVSEQLSQQKLPAASPAGRGCCPGAEEQRGCCMNTTAPGADAQANFLPLLCYGCRLTIKDTTCLESLPLYVRSEAERRKRRAAMKLEIQEFLLEDEAVTPAGLGPWADSPVSSG
ncbi:cytoplasmic tRNA 2-thiolation protein 2 isoform X1 [Gopherus evgoodei]|uniref:cytoplasmic tRNA 2-thiolation protein 2 isoform X1 n=3 Tax=Gopherus evgoodei TaxID=1825980 RepID=UPI0011CEDA20|nr:cytoplasmic tRNA 2-thiolation protein 2 isoform X1 [Gopherus evgoodei]